MANKSFVVQYLIKSRDNFSKAAIKIAKNTKKMRTEINFARKAFVKFGAKASRALDKFKAKAREAFDQFGAKARQAGAILTAAVTVPILFMARSLKDAARDAQETQSKFNTVFKSLSAESNAVAKNLSDNFGLSSSKAKELLANTGDLLTGFGFTQKAALDLSKKVNELAVDLASFTNFSGGAEGASASLTKALLGERESLKTLGVAILEADVKTKVLKLIAEGQTFATLRQAKAHATLAIALEQSKNAIGDFARTSEELANQERITSAAIQDLKESFGLILLPAALALTRAIRSMAKWFENLSPVMKKVILIFAGILAVLGPLLLIIGTIILALPFLSAAFAALGVVLGVVLVVALNPFVLIAFLLAKGASLIINNWGKVKAFFVDFAAFIKSKIAPVIETITEGIEKIANFKANLSGFIAATAATFKTDFFGPEARPPTQISPTSRVEVGVKVGLDKGLKQTAPTLITTESRRSDVGAVAA